MSDLEDSIERLQNWKFERRHEQTDLFRDDLSRVLEAAAMLIPQTTGTLDVKPWCNESGQNSCSCHERDGSQVCDFCKSQGYRGHCE
jgi:hypothetical protein